MFLEFDPQNCAVIGKIWAYIGFPQGFVAAFIVILHRILAYSIIMRQLQKQWLFRV